MATDFKRQQRRRGTAAAWVAVAGTADDALASGEDGYETDTGFYKTGPGNFSTLPYANPELTVSDPAKTPLVTTGTQTELDVDALATETDLTTALTGIYAPVVSRLTSDSSGNATTTPAATGLSLAIGASPAIYEIRGLIWFSAVAAADASFTWGTTPAGIAGRWTVGGPSAAAAYEATSRLWSEALACGGSGTGANYTAMDLFGILVAGTAGTLALSFAQATSDATAVTIRAQSTLIARRIV